MKSIFYLLIRYKAELLLLVLLEISLLIRVYEYNYLPSYFFGEPVRDYLIAHLIYKYHEFPLRGVFDTGANFLPNSPFFYYFLSFFLFIKDDYYFLDKINLILQLANIIIIYLLAKKLFNVPTALIAASVFAVGDYFVSQSKMVWQPYIIQPFANLSYLVLAISYQKRSYPILIISMIIFILTITLHRSALAQLPLLLVLIFLILLSWKAKIEKYFYVIAVFIATILLLYLPVLYLSIFVGKLSSGQEVPNPGGFFHFLLQNISLFLESIFAGKIFPVQYSTPLSIIGFSLLVYFLFKKDNPYRKVIFVIVIAILLQLLLATGFRFTPQIRYFTPIMGLFVILISFILFQTGKGSKFNNLIGVILFALVIYSVSPNLYNKLNASLKISQKAVLFSTLAVIDKVAKIKTAENLSTAKFFRIISYRNNREDGRIDAAFWIPLEKVFNEKFVTIDDKSIVKHYSETTRDDYYFIICYYDSNNYKVNIEQACINEFAKTHKNHQLTDLVYQDIQYLSVYLAKKE